MQQNPGQDCQLSTSPRHGHTHHHPAGNPFGAALLVLGRQGLVPGSCFLPKQAQTLLRSTSAWEEGNRSASSGRTGNLCRVRQLFTGTLSQFPSSKLYAVDLPQGQILTVCSISRSRSLAKPPLAQETWPAGSQESSGSRSTAPPAVRTGV